MKTVLAALLLATCALYAADAHRTLQAVVTATATATATGGGNAVATADATDSGTSNSPTSADAVAKASDGGSADTTAIAKDGADVSAATEATGEGAGATLSATGEGEVTIDASLTVESANPLDVTVIVAKYEDGGDFTAVAIDLEKEFQDVAIPIVIKTLLTLAADETKLPIYQNYLVYLHDNLGCDGFKAYIKGYETYFLQYPVVVIHTCLYPSCSAYPSGKDCCGTAQLEQAHCSCEADGCAWTREGPDYKSPYGIWFCDTCTPKVDYCVCY